MEAHTYRKLAQGQAATGYSTLESLIGETPATEIAGLLDAVFSSHNNDAESDVRFTEIGNADRFVHRHGNDAMYCAELKSWLLWKNGRWAEDVTNQVYLLGEQTVRSIIEEGSTINSRGERDRMLKHGMASCTEAGIRHLLGIAEAKMPVRAEILDRNPWLLNCRNGTVDLRTGHLLSHDRKCWITKQVPIDYVPGAECPRFKQFLDEITDGDTALIDFLGRALGYSLTGVTDEQCFFIAYGDGANGKSTLLGVFRHILADYARNIPVQTLVVKKNEGGASPEIVRLRGARYVTAAEAEAHQKMAESLVKQLTGGDTITARALFRDSIDFLPEFKLWLATNHKPRVSGTDPAMWRRIHLIPFTTVIAPEKRDGELAEKLKMEAPGILAWAVRGCRDWQNQGLNPPEPVKQATAAYRSEMDEVGRFLAECVERHVKGTVTKQELFSAYDGWVQENGNERLNQAAFGSRLKAIGLDDGKSGAKRFWKGVRLTQREWDQDLEEDLSPVTDYLGLENRPVG